VFRFYFSHSLFECCPFFKLSDDEISLCFPESFFLLTFDIFILLLLSTSCKTSFTFDLFFKSIALLDFNASERIVRRIRDFGPNSGLRIKSNKTLIHE